MEFSSIKPKKIGVTLYNKVGIEEFADHLNKKFLFYKLWGFKPEDLHQNLRLKEDLNQVLKQMTLWADEHFEAKVVYGIFKCIRENEVLKIFNTNLSEPDKNIIERFIFERETQSPFRSLLDFYPESEDYIAFQLVSLGQKAVDFGQSLKEENRYQDFFYWYGYCSAMTEALASSVHYQIRSDLNILRAEESVEDCLSMKFQGKRYSFGYNWCRNMEEQRKVLKLLSAKDLNIEMNESDELEPEFSTCAVVIHNQQAIYW